MHCVDTHFHVPPDALERRATAEDVARQALESSVWTVFKSHTTETVTAAKSLRDQGYPVSGSVVLGPGNSLCAPSCIRETSQLNRSNGGARLIVYLPTGKVGDFSATRREWISDGSPTRALEELMRVCSEEEVILATGHLGRLEVETLYRMRREFPELVVLLTHCTHPIGGLGFEDIARYLSDTGWFGEVTELTSRYGRRPFGEMLEVLNHDRVLLSSDHGQPESPARSEWPEVIERYQAAYPKYKELILEASTIRPRSLIFDHGGPS
ncbi:DUF6282 family protein [Corynebacterium variabile]|uniref:DUF6282 family protein n=1 Tax=Corynebacterium variabile TaxID=1727 RepID=UPI003BB00DE6